MKPPRLFESVKVSKEKDGALFLVLPRRDVPLCFTGLRVAGGASLEAPDKAGLADLAADLLNEGPEGFKALEWHRRLDRDALRVTAYPSTLSWSGFCESLSEDRKETRALFQKMISKPRLPKGDWKRIQSEALAEEKERWAQPAEILEPWARAQALGRGHLNAREIHPGSLKRSSYAEARTMAENSFIRGSWVSGVAGGDIDEDEAFSSLREMADSLRRAPDKPEADLRIHPSTKPVWILDHPKLDQAFLALSRPGILAGDPDRVALRLARYALGEGDFSSRLMNKLRTEAGSTYGVKFALPERKTPAPLLIQTFTRVETLGATLDLIRKTLKEVAEDGFTEEEAAASRDHLYGNFPLRLSTPSAVLRQAYRALQAGLTLQDLEDDWGALRDTPLEKINRAARRFLGNLEFRLALIGPASKILPQLKSWGEAEVLPFSASPDDWPD